MCCKLRRMEEIDAAQLMVTRNTEMVEADAGEELIGLHVDNGICYSFNPTAKRVWQLIEQPRTLAAIRDALVREFQVDPALCEAEVRVLLADLATDHMVELSRA